MKVNLLEIDLFFDLKKGESGYAANVVTGTNSFPYGIRLCRFVWDKNNKNEKSRNSIYDGFNHRFCFLTI